MNPLPTWRCRPSLRFRWRNRDWINAPEASFVALADGQVVGVASLQLDADQPGRAENGYTAVRREWRGKVLRRR
jgi:hypothetical protein